MIGCSILNNSVMAVFIYLSKPVAAIADWTALKLHAPTRTTLPASASSVGIISMDDFEQPGSAHAATDAHGHHAVFGLAATSLDQKMSGQAGPGHAIGVADRDRTAIDIEFLGIDAQFVAAINHLDGIGLIQLPQIDVVDLQAMTLEQARDRRHRADAHLVRLDACRDKTAKDAQRI